MTLASLPLFVRLAGRPVILLGDGAAADAKRRLLERAGALVCGEASSAAVAIVAVEDDDAAKAAVARLKARGILVNAVDRPALCDFTLPALVERGPVLIAIGTSGVSAGLAAALRQRLEALLPAGLGGLANALQAARGAIRAQWPDAGDRRHAIARALAPGGQLDPLGFDADVDAWLSDLADVAVRELTCFKLHSTDPDDLTLRQARALAQADRIYHRSDVPMAILDRARADADRIAAASAPIEPLPGISVFLEMGE
ncbi:MAG: NAD(P)-dependent oxidoreductase [Sphingomonas sp.]|jgi:uroporphyrin-III C-methyltransferase/precorrin-2 dehydrogenase/sirohydrochlorin ferrochelatase